MRRSTSNPTISLFANVRQTKGSEISAEDFIDKIRTGHWQDYVLPVRTAKNKEEKDREKKKAPAATMAGTFTERNSKGLNKASGLLAQDIDNLTPEAINDIKAEICCDPHVYACFISISGKGLCVLFRVNPKAFSESFNATAAYIYKKFKQEVKTDASCKDICRLRIVSYDPDAYFNPDAKEFYVKAETKAEKARKVYKKYPVSSEVSDRVLNEIMARQIDITSDYDDWNNIGFALAKTYGEDGRPKFHAISQYHPEYNYDDTDRKFTNLLATGRDPLNMGVIYNIAKRHGIEIYSPKEREVIKLTSQGKKAGLQPAQIKNNLVKFGVISETDAPSLSPIIEQSYEKDVQVEPGNIVSEIELFIKSNYSLKRNVVTRHIELNGKAITDIEINSIYLACRRAIEDTTKELVRSILYSDSIPSYNPIHDFFKEYANDKLKERNLTDLINSIKTDTHNAGLFIKKWLVGIIASAHGDHSPLMLVLCGGQNTGKTYWFRHLLPEPLQPYFADCKFLNGKDDEILMTKKLILLDDELSGKTKNEERKLKELLSKQVFSLREPYGMVSVDLTRLASLCGTSNTMEILTDLTGNRRILPINVLSIDHGLYNKVNKYHLFIECYNLWKSGYTHHLTGEEIKILNESTTDFEAVSVEEEQFFKYYAMPQDPCYNVAYVTASDIASKIMNNTRLTVNPVKIGMVLKKLGFEQVKKKVNGNSIRTYRVVEK